MPDLTTVVDTYIEMWNETDPQRRRALIAATVTEDSSYLDPMMAGEGPDGIDALIAGAQQQFPDHRFTLLDGVDAHHDRVRFSWSLAPVDGEPIAVGLDFATVASDGRLREITGFLPASA